MEDSPPLYDWIANLSPSLLEKEKIPMWGAINPFPWQNFATQINELFGLDSLQLKPKTWRWRSSEQLEQGLAEDCHQLDIGWSGYEGSVSLLFDQTIIPQLMKQLFISDPHHTREITCEGYIDGFFHFLILHVLRSVEDCGWQEKSHFFLLKTLPLPKEDMLGLDVDVILPNMLFTLRVLVHEKLRKSIQEAAERANNPVYNHRLAESLQMEVSLQVGHVQLSQQQWSSLGLGDLLLLDHCSLSKDLDSGMILMSAKGLPLYNLKLAKGKTTIEGNALFRKVIEDG